MLAEKIFDIIKDYQCDYDKRKYNLSPDHIQIWANQFGHDADFVLSEMLYFLPEIYLSKERARNLIKNRLINFQNSFGYLSMDEFIASTHFFDVQALEKSQGEILLLVDELLKTEYKIAYKDLRKNPKKHFIYFDDVLATGGTILRDLMQWFNEIEDGISNKEAILSKKRTLAISLFCCHSLGFGNFEWQLMKHVDDNLQKLLIVKHDYLIENNLKTKWMAARQRLNCAYPVGEQSKEVISYLSELDAGYDRIPAFRPKNLPTVESFFSSPGSRIKLENLFL
jgi:hypothetical protein